ncbi:MAG: rhodanese-like domain-containing protein [Gammaproteobacteria bacterium]|nr:rhodanese-like domain-containing protein [Gammaproteobacteria bacterium]MDH5692832.1 rhodanese-like domain-containing protein [Gammaproteobacteria bacterium]
MSSIVNLTPTQLKERLDSHNPDLVLLDVRQDWEYEICHLPGSISLPLNQIRDAIEQFEPSQAILCICHHGVRSRHAALALQGMGFESLYNLLGGMDAWATQVDPNMARY